jgi:urease accessory protein
MLRATSYVLSAEARERKLSGFDLVVLDHGERRVRRRLLTLVHGDEVLVDLPFTVGFDNGDLLVLDDGRYVDVIAAEELLYEVRGRDMTHLMQLAWHLGNRHLPVQIEPEWEGIGHRILILRDHVIGDMLVGLGATVSEISEPFHPLNGAYHGHSHGDTSHALLNK